LDNTFSDGRRLRRPVRARRWIEWWRHGLGGGIDRPVGGVAPWRPTTRLVPLTPEARLLVTLDARSRPPTETEASPLSRLEQRDDCIAYPNLPQDGSDGRETAL